jgi:hypothetical protein
MKDQPPIFLTDINIHSDTQAEPRELSSLTLYIDLWQEGKPAPGQNPPVISPPVVIFRRIGVRAEIRTQNPVLSNTRLVKMVPLSHPRRRVKTRICEARCHFARPVAIDLLEVLYSYVLDFYIRYLGFFRVIEEVE